MAANQRQSKMARRGAPEASRRQPAWTGARASPTFSPTNTTAPRPPNVASPVNPTSFPPLAQTNGASPQDRLLQSLSGLTGTTITLLTKTGQRYEGVVGSTNAEGDTTGVTLKDVKEITNLSAPLKDQFFIASTNIESWTSGPADAKLTNGDSFRTDTDISRKGPAAPLRELQPWQPASDAPPGAAVQGDDATFGPGSTNTSWDQFAVNEQLFGVTASFDEDAYTTKLDRNAPDYKERERKAQRIANEINGSTTNNPHLAEERNQQLVDDSGMNEEDKYGAVVRGTNAYVPPGARKPGSKSDVPAVSVNGPDGTAVATQSPPSSSKAPSPAPSANSNKPPADPLPAFRDFVTNEKQRLTQKRQALQKSEMDKRMAELVKFSQSFKLNKPIPDDLVPILAKDEDKQRAIREKASKDAASNSARNIGPSATTTPVNARPTGGAAKVQDAARKPSAPTGSKAPTNTAAPATVTQKNGAAPAKADAKSSKVNMVIQAIPPFKGDKGAATKSRQSSQSTAPNANRTPTPAESTSSSALPKPPNSPATNNRLNVNASSFRPNPKGGSSSSVASSSVSPKPKEVGTSTPNPFFGPRSLKKSAPVNVKDDFNPFKHNKVADPASVAPTWAYTGKRYMQMFPAPPHVPQQHPGHMPPPGPPPMPPPSYEEDSAAQAAARGVPPGGGGYIYYPPYGYTGQPMMPGMPPPAPPGAFMPGPYMQPMPYPPGMPPTMYAPQGMGQMPPQGYMPPPPGSYPQPPNGNGPRQSMPPTPIPAHAHPYYHSPQLQHAVPYQMMMPPPNGGPPHPYDGGPAPPVMNHA
ncbi:hypothetical protein C8J56DRAFT_930391 [Mycena floridula]|nr:hypothetical protein C8J56DRAFT_930391 [Mycena floridula]